MSDNFVGRMSGLTVIDLSAFPETVEILFVAFHEVESYVGSF